MLKQKKVLRDYIHQGKSFAIISIKNLDNNKIEFRLYSRDYNSFYNDGYGVYKIINFTKYQRKEKIKKLNEKFSYR